MHTAREQLLLDVLHILKTVRSIQWKPQIDQLLDGYRIQTKTKTLEKTSSVTARTSLHNELNSLVAQPAPKEETFRQVLANYRIQRKQSQTVPKSSPVASEHPKNHSAWKRLLQLEPVAGGPRKRAGTRGECPKCKSQGIVLAHSNSGEDYLSCIYCGFQAYTKAQHHDLDLALSIELMGRRFDEQSDLKETNDPE